MQIIATTIKDGTDSNVQSDSAENQLASTITVLVSLEQARLLAELEQNGTIHAALVYRGNSQTAQMFLEAQAAALAELYPDEPEETEDTGEALPEDSEAPPADTKTQPDENEQP